MLEITNRAKETVALLNGSLIVGNHDTITLLGAEAQSRLQDYTRTVSKLLLKDNGDLEIALIDVVVELEAFENALSQKPSFLRPRLKRYRDFESEVQKIISHIDKITLVFQLQKVQLLKEIKLLENLSSVVQESIDELEKSIREGTVVLENRHSHNSPNAMFSETDDDYWYSRLERRIDDLRISRTVTFQNHAQIKILRNNNLALLDRISSSISSTLPLWQNQIITLLGVEKLNDRIAGQNHFLNFSTKYMQVHKKMLTERPHGSEREPVNINEVVAVNGTLKSELVKISELEIEDKNIRETLQKV